MSKWTLSRVLKIMRQMYPKLWNSYRRTHILVKLREGNEIGYGYGENRIQLYRAWILTPWCRVLLEQLTGLQLVKKFPAFHGTRRFITALTSVRHLSPSWASPIQSIHLLEIHPNIIHPSTPRSPLGSISLRFPHHPYMDTSQIIFLRENKLVRNSLTSLNLVFLQTCYYILIHLC